MVEIGERVFRNLQVIDISDIHAQNKLGNNANYCPGTAGIFLLATALRTREDIQIFSPQTKGKLTYLTTESPSPIEISVPTKTCECGYEQALDKSLCCCAGGRTKRSRYLYQYYTVLESRISLNTINNIGALKISAQSSLSDLVDGSAQLTVHHEVQSGPVPAFLHGNPLFH